jgi:hypothetical protein
MTKLRRHRKAEHPKARKESSRKKKLDPVKQRKGLIANPRVKSYADFQSVERTGSLIRVLDRVDNTFFPELALYLQETAPRHDPKRLSEILMEAGFTKEGRSKHVFRSNKFNVFVYV